jgi:hypothetical protein
MNVAPYNQMPEDVIQSLREESLSLTNSIFRGAVEAAKNKEDLTSNCIGVEMNSVSNIALSLFNHLLAKRVDNKETYIKFLLFELDQQLAIIEGKKDKYKAHAAGLVRKDKPSKESMN